MRSRRRIAGKMKMPATAGVDYCSSFDIGLEFDVYDV